MVATEMALPKEYRKGWFAGVSRTFVLILVASVVVHFGLMVLLLSRPKQEKEEVPAATQARLATLIVRHAQPPKETPLRASVTVPAPREAREAAPGGADVASRTPRRGTASSTPGSGVVGTGVEGPLSAGHARTRDRLAAEASSTGILRVLNAGSGAAGDQARELLGGEEPSADIGAVLGSVGGLKSTGAPTREREVRGTRTTETGTIDTLLDELGTATSSTVVRGGSLVVGPVTPVGREGEVTTLAGRDPDQVSKVVNGHNDAIEYCYQKELKRNPTLKGKLVVRFTINPQGKVSSATIVSSTLNSPELEACILRRIQRWDDFGAVDASLGDATFRQVYTFGF
ncbi:MAG: TonB family protein [Calditrichaeota bacterium]|nr:TonB family protein [Calditrichota bacterium]